MIGNIRRQTLMIMGLATSLAISLLFIALNQDLREKLGDAYWIVGFALIAAILLVLAGYVFDRTLLSKLKDLNQHTASEKSSPDTPSSGDPDDVMGLARKIEQMARSLQRTEASYRAIVEDQADLICRYKSDGRLTFINGAYAQFQGRKRAELLGQPWHILAAGLTPWRPFDPWPESATFETTLHSPDSPPRDIQWSHRAIKDHEGQLIEYQAVGHDVSVRKQAELALRSAKESAESADRAKSEFLAIVSHEIRTPINGVLGFTRLLRGTSLTPEQTSYVDTIQSCGRSLETLVSDILDLSKIEAGHMEINPAPFSLSECIDEILRLFAQPALNAGLTLQSTIATDVPPILEGDQNRLRQILINLVGNAVKFTEKGSVTLHLSGEYPPGSPAAPDQSSPYLLRAEVRDTGIGMAPEDLPRLFRAFSQLDTSSTRRHGGTGLGLVISKRLCQLMRGDISVESTPGVGSTFRFHLQMAVPKSAA